MTPLLTLVTTCKPFRGEFEQIQTNALVSWAKLVPTCEVVIGGNEPGVRERCQTLEFRHIEEIPRTSSGTPLLNGLLEAAERVAAAELIGLTNADIMLTSEVLVALEQIKAKFEKFLLIARRWNVDLERTWNFDDASWESRLRDFARSHGKLEPVYGGIDLFIYPKGVWGTMLPPFAIGRGRWDSALIFEACKKKIPVVDVTPVVTCVHQNHSYIHHPQAAEGVFKGPEAVTNNKLLGGEENIFTSLNASHILDETGLHRQLDLYPPFLLRRMATWPALYRPLRPLAAIVRLAAPSWRRFTRFCARSDDATS